MIVQVNQSNSSGNDLSMDENLNQAFPNTRWSLISRAQSDDPAVQQAAKETLFASYLPVLKVYLMRRKKMDFALADDLVQEFALKKLLKLDIIRNVQKEKGKFRSFLLTCLNNLISDHFRTKRNQEQPADQAVFLNNEEVVEDDYEFDSIWARNVFVQSLSKMKRECDSTEKGAHWTVFFHRVLIPLTSSQPPLSYQELVSLVQADSAKAVQNMLATSKRTFQRCLKEVIEDYVDNSDHVEQEIQALCQALTQGGSLEFKYLKPLIPEDMENVFQPGVFEDRQGLESLLTHCKQVTMNWQDTDLREMWKQFLFSPVSDYCSREISNAQLTINELFFSNLDLVDCLDDVRKTCRSFAKQSSLAVYRTGYLVAVAAMIVVNNGNPTNISDANWRPLFDDALNLTWLDQDSKQLLSIAANILNI